MSKVFCKTIFLSAPPVSWKVMVVSGAMPASLAMKDRYCERCTENGHTSKRRLLIVSYVDCSQDNDLGVPTHSFV